MSFSTRMAAFVMLALAAAPAHAHGISVWIVVAALSPLLVLILIAIYGLLTRSWRAALAHTAILAVWVAWFWLASNHNEVRLFGLPTDYVIWTALALYAAHALYVVALVVKASADRINARKRAAWN